MKNQTGILLFCITGNHEYCYHSAQNDPCYCSCHVENKGLATPLDEGDFIFPLYELAFGLWRINMTLKRMSSSEEVITQQLEIIASSESRVDFQGLSAPEVYDLLKPTIDCPFWSVLELDNRLKEKGLKVL